MENEKEKIIDLSEVVRLVFSHKMLFVKVLVIAFVLSAAYILPEPRTYTTTTTLAPEMSSMSGGGGTLGELAASFGVDLGGMQSVDAIYPTLYPDIMQSTDFVVGLFDSKVESMDGEIKTTYFDYMKTKQKSSFWFVPFKWIKKQIENLFSSNEPQLSGKGGVDPAMLSKKQFDVFKKIAKNVSCTVDKKTDVITIVVTDQDKLICKTIADSVCNHLQRYIINYRTNKARTDVAYYEKLMNDAEAKYTKERNAYSAYADANMDVSLPSYRQKLEDMENRMQLSYNSFTALQTQYIAAQSKLQERTPSFTTIQCATLPQKATGPKRMIFVAAMMMLAFFGTLAYLYYSKKQNLH